jgi:hypothetical protein
MTERPQADPRSAPGGLHFQISKLLVGAIALATAATGALIVTVLIEMPPASVPPPVPNGMPPPPPNLQALAVFPIVTGFFVLAWLAVLIVVSRDQILLRLRQQQDAAPTPLVSRDDLNALLAELRSEIAADRERDLDALGEQLAEYGERRETDGYLNGMRTVAASEPPEANVRSFRRNPPPR